MPRPNYSLSDKLAIALACGSVVVLIALYLAEKTPLVVGLLVLLMLALSIYPILHFIRRTITRLAAILVVLAAASIFGSQALKYDRQGVQVPPLPIAAHVPPLAPAPQPQATPSLKGKKSTGNNLQQPTYSVNNPTGSIINQGSPNYGTQTVNNVPPSRTLSEDALASFAAELEKAKEGGTLRVVLASSADDVFPLSQQLCAAAKSANWGLVCPSARSSIMGREAVADGLECYSDNWEASDAVAFKNATKAAQLPCDYIPKAYSFGPGITLGGTGGLTILIGKPKHQ